MAINTDAERVVLYREFCEWCNTVRHLDLDPRLHTHSGRIEDGGYISDRETATAFAAWKAARHATAAPQPQVDGRDAAWSDLKIAFDIPGGEDETLWKCVESGAITLPNGWKLIETTGAGGVGPVAIFRTEHLPTSSETFVVGSAINYAIAAAKKE